MLIADCRKLSFSFELGEALGERVAVDLQTLGSAQEIAVVPGNDFEDEALLELLHRFGEENTFVDHLGAKRLETILEPGLGFGGGVTHERSPD